MINFSYFKYLWQQYIFRKRWLMVIFTGLLLGYWAGYVIDLLSGGLLPGQDGGNGNALEGFIWAFGKPEIVYYAATALYIYLIADFLPESAAGQTAMFRLRSRKKWWAARVVLLFTATLLFAVLLFGGFFAMLLPGHPLDSQWSMAGLNNLGMGIGLLANSIDSPLMACVWIAVFLLLGWFSLGFLVMTVNLLTDRSWVGFLVVALLLLSGELGSVVFGGQIGGAGWFSLFLLQNHLEYTPLWSPVRVLPEWVSLLFWGLCILICFVTGDISSRRRDFLAMYETGDE